jgi:hypothetical protein
MLQTADCLTGVNVWLTTKVSRSVIPLQTSNCIVKHRRVVKLLCLADTIQFTRAHSDEDFPQVRMALELVVKIPSVALFRKRKINQADRRFFNALKSYPEETRFQSGLELRVFLQFLKANAGIVSLICQYHFLTNPFQFITYIILSYEAI